MTRGLKLTVSVLGLAVAGLLPAPALAQNSWTVDALIRGSAESVPLKPLDIESRAERRYAIVVGNSGYQSIPSLPNAHADARVMAAFLESQGYEVHHHEDISKRDFEGVLRRALFDIDRDTEVVVFFAGHGFQIGSENYLVPVDADLDSVYDVPFEAVSLGSLVGIVGSRARLQIVILDSCRDNPFAGKTALTQVGSELRETRTGFSSQAAPLNSSLIYSTSPGAVAFDGEGENSPFTAALIDQAQRKPNAPIKDLFERVRRAVYEKTDGRQVPWDSSTLVEPASFGFETALSRPINVAVTGGGVSRGVARVAPAAAAVGEIKPRPVAATVALVEAPFTDEVEIGPALIDALGLSQTDKVTITQDPANGRLLSEDATGFRRSAVGKTLTGAELSKLLLKGDSVQVPALSLEGGVIEDTLSVRQGDAETQIALRLIPDQCDFHAGDHIDPDGMGITRYPNELEPEIALAACQASIEKEPGVGRFHYQAGRALVALGRADEARVAYERARDLGHSRAWNALGGLALNDLRAREGSNAAAADDEVLGLFARGVDEGDPYAFYSLGRQFLLNGGTSEIEIEGYDLMMRALEVGHTFAMNELGYFYLDEDSDYYDPERGLRYLKESAARDDIYGFNNMGLVYSRGLGKTDVDDAAAFEMFVKAAEGGHPYAPANVARMYRNGRASGGTDIAKAVEWYGIGLERGDSLSGGTAAYLIANEGVEGYSIFDAAVFAAKAAALERQADAERSRDLLSEFPASAINGGSQQLLNALGADVTVDGAFGPGSEEALAAIVATYGVSPPSGQPVDRIVSLAKIYWQTSPFRVDLY
ncbi:MAG: caspase family protein [Pseudomonadota bacterium]